MYFFPEYQNKGIGQQLILTILQHAKKDYPTLSKVILKVLNTNIQAIRCYEKAGFATKELIMYKKI
jgi:ribosomal protein S18 acetylase RimI-like enzyme